MLDVSEAIKEQTKETIVPFYFYDKLDDKQINTLLENIGLKVSGGKEAKVYRLFSFLQNEKEISSELSDCLNDFFLDTIKYTSNRIMIEVPIKFSNNSISLKKNTLLANVRELEVNHIMSLIINPENNILVNDLSGEFKLIYRHAKFDGADVEQIELAYVRHVEYAIKNGNNIKKVNKYEYVWCDINISKAELKIFISNNRKTTDDKQEDGTIHSMKEFFSNKLSKEFDFRIASVNDSQTLFKIYRELTSETENKYSAMVTPYEPIINDFVEEMKNNLNIEDNEDIDLANRITKLLERNLIQKDFEKIRKDPQADGRVISLDFHDGTGSSVKATTGGVKHTDDGLVLLDMQDSDVYFDTKETIYSLKSLGILVVEWNAIRDFPKLEDRYQKPKATYIAYKDYYICSINRINLNKEISDYVLSKFERYRNLPI